MSERRVISAGHTSFTKWVAPIGSALIFLGYLYSWLSGGQSDTNWKWAVLFTFVTALLAIWGRRRLRHVSIDDRGLYVSNRKEEVLIPFSEITEVREYKSSRGRSITVVLRTASRVGRSFAFIPSGHRPLFQSHPVAAELRERVANVVALPRR
jgi:hypothetical protein